MDQVTNQLAGASNISEMLDIAAYILAALALFGIVLLGIGAFRKKRELIERGGLLFLFSLIIGTCLYFIYDTAVKRVSDNDFQTDMPVDPENSTIESPSTFYNNNELYNNSGAIDNSGYDQARPYQDPSDQPDDQYYNY